MAGLDTTTGSNILKKVYLPSYYDELVNNTRITLALLKKDEAFTGSSREFTFLSSYAQTVNFDFATAQTAAATGASKWVRGSLVGLSKHAPCSISGDLIAQAGDDQGAYLRPVKQAIDASIQNLLNRLGAECLGSGWGDIGTIETSSISGATLRLLNASDMIKVEVGQKHVFSQSQAANGLRASAGSLTVSGVDRDSRTVTYTANVSTLSGVTDGDFVFNQGDRQDSSTPTRQCMAGMQAWIPFASPSSGESFFGVDRSVDPQRLAGHRYDASNGASNLEALQTGAMQVASTGGSLSHFIVNPTVFNNIALELTTRVRYEPAKEGVIGFSSLALNTAAGDVRIISDRFQPASNMMGVNMSKWSLVSKGKVVKINDDDGNMILRDPSNDGVQSRIVARNYQLFCSDPSQNINVKLS